MTIPLSQRFTILERDEFTCRYCGRKAPETELEVDHVHPRSKGGSDDVSNLATTCRNCNQGKGDRVLRPVVPDASEAWRTLAGASFLIGDDERGPIAKGDILAEPTPGFVVALVTAWRENQWASKPTARLVPVGEIAADGWRLYRDSRDGFVDLIGIQRARRPRALPSAVPIAWAMRVRGERGWLWLVDQCPFCGEEHAHAAGALTTDPRETLGERLSQCGDGPAQKYVLDEAPF